MDASPDRPTTDPTPGDLMGARMLNSFGLFSPLANVALLQLGPREVRWMGVGAGVLLWLIGGWAAAADVMWANRAAFGVHYLLVLIGLLDPRWPIVVFRGWIAFGHLLGKVFAIPVFVAVYLVAVTPLALVMRALGKDPLRRKAPPAESYWEDHTPPPKEKLERQF